MFATRTFFVCLLGLLLVGGCGSDHTHDHDPPGHDDTHAHNGQEHTHDDHADEEHTHAHDEPHHGDDDHAHDEHEDHSHGDHTHDHDDEYVDHEHEEHAHDDEHASGIHLPVADQQAIGLAVDTARTGEVSATVSASGTIEPVAGQHAVVAAPATGLIRADRNLEAPVPGDRVRAGDVLAVLAPTDDGSYAALKARVERLQREVERAERLYADDAIPERRLVEARHDLEVAAASLESIGGSTEDEGYNMTLRAPLDGWVQQRMLTPGTHVATGDRLFTVANTERVWLRVHVPAASAAQIRNEGQQATFTVEGHAESFATDQIVSVGSAIDPDERTLPVVFRVDNSDERFKIGMLAEARLPVARATRGVTIPSTAIRAEDGIPVAYVQTHADTFERRILQTGPSDGVHTIVEAGIESGEVVVTQGAYQVYLASVDTEAGGHHHHH